MHMFPGNTTLADHARDAVSRIAAGSKMSGYVTQLSSDGVVAAVAVWRAPCEEAVMLLTASLHQGPDDAVAAVKAVAQLSDKGNAWKDCLLALGVGAALVETLRTFHGRADVAEHVRLVVKKLSTGSFSRKKQLNDEIAIGLAAAAATSLST